MAVHGLKRKEKKKKKRPLFDLRVPNWECMCYKEREREVGGKKQNKKTKKKNEKKTDRTKTRKKKGVLNWQFQS